MRNWQMLLCLFGPNMPAPVAFVPLVVKNIEVFRRNLQELVAANVVATEREK
jgi:hypothetical protein